MGYEGACVGELVMLDYDDDYDCEYQEIRGQRDCGKKVEAAFMAVPIAFLLDRGFVQRAGKEKQN